jgi:hypothetical protein
MAGDVPAKVRPNRRASSRSPENSYHEQGGKVAFRASEKHMREIRNHVGHNDGTSQRCRSSCLGTGDGTRRGRSACYRVTPDGRTGGQPRSLSGAAFWRPAAARRNRPLARYGSAVLFDEPILALDPQLVGEVLSVIRGLAHEHDLTMLLVTREMRFASSTRFASANRRRRRRFLAYRRRSGYTNLSLLFFDEINCLTKTSREGILKVVIGFNLSIPPPGFPNFRAIDFTLILSAPELSARLQ